MDLQQRRREANVVERAGGCYCRKCLEDAVFEECLVTSIVMSIKTRNSVTALDRLGLDDNAVVDFGDLSSLGTACQQTLF